MSINIAAQRKNDAAQRKINAALPKNDAAQIKVNAAQTKSDAAQAKVNAAQVRYDAAQVKINAAQRKVRAEMTKVQGILIKISPGSRAPLRRTGKEQRGQRKTLDLSILHNYLLQLYVAIHACPNLKPFKGAKTLQHICRPL